MNTVLLVNPYRQLEAWYLNYLYSLEYGERCLAAVQAVYDKMMEYDARNKNTHKPTLDEKAPYNFWIDVPITLYLDKMVSRLKERVLYKRKYPHHTAGFGLYFSDVLRFKQERQHWFDAAQPAGIDVDAPGELNALLDKAYHLDDRISYLTSRRDPVSSILTDLDDGRVRDYFDVFRTRDADDNRVKRAIKEPAVYPHYRIHRQRRYPTGEQVTQTGVWMPEFDYMSMFYYDLPQDKLLKGYYPQEKIILGPKEYGLIPGYDFQTDTVVSKGNTKSATFWVYLEEIAPDTEGIANNPLRLNDLRSPQGDQVINVLGGQLAPYSGIWVCPNIAKEEILLYQYVKQGDLLLAGESERGIYIWYYRPESQYETYQQVVNRYIKKYQNHYANIK